MNIFYDVFWHESAGAERTQRNEATMAKKMKKPLRSPSERPCARNHLGPNTTTNHMDDGGRPCGYVDVLIVCVRPVLLSFQLVFKVEHLRSRCTNTRCVCDTQSSNFHRKLATRIADDVVERIYEAQLHWAYPRWSAIAVVDTWWYERKSRKLLIWIIRLIFCTRGYVRPS